MSRNLVDNTMRIIHHAASQLAGCMISPIGRGDSLARKLEEFQAALPP